MNEKVSSQDNLPPLLGTIEPHAAMLNIPLDNQLLYKMMTIENLLRSIKAGYLHFNRVDSYTDFTGADEHDSQQLPRDQKGNTSIKFEKSPHFSAADYYNSCRSRTYACCFSLENSDFIWNNYANDSVKGKVCVVFDFGKLRKILNQTLRSGNALLEYNGIKCHQILSVNYGIIQYIEWQTHQANTEHLPNPIYYTYIKDKNKFEKEKEFRISLSAMGTGHLILKDGRPMSFSKSLQMAFDFRTAIANNTIQQILHTHDSDSDFIQTELHKLGIMAKKK